MSGRIQFHLVGLTHIDLAWVRDSRHYEDCQERMVLRLLDLLDREPAMTYVIEQVAHYRALHRRRPELIERLRKHVESGRVEMAGGMASSPDTNGPNGEGYVRNHLLGRAWTKRFLGGDVVIGDLIDTFGLSAQTPQIHKQLGMHGLTATRLGGQVWDTVSRYRGLDGSEIILAAHDWHTAIKRDKRVHLTFLQGSADLLDRYMTAIEASNPAPGPHLVFAYDENEWPPMGQLVDEMAKRQGGGAWRYSTLRDYFKAVEAAGLSLPTIDGDLNPSFTGCYGLRPWVRLRNREVETKLIEAEKWAALLGDASPVGATLVSSVAGRSTLADDTSVAPTKAVLDEAWWLMSYVQSHDVYSGSFPEHRVAGEVRGWLDEAEKIAEDVLTRVLGPATTAPAGDTVIVTLYNGLPHQREDVADIARPANWPGVSSVTAGGKDVPFEVTETGVRVRATVPAAGSIVLTLVRGEAVAPASWEDVDDAVLESPWDVRATFTAAAGLTALWGEGQGNVVENAGGLLVVQKDVGSYQVDEPAHAEIPADLSPMRLSIRETGLSKQVRLSGTFPHLGWAGPGNKLEWAIVFEFINNLVENTARLDVRVSIDWKGESSRVRLRVPTTIDSHAGLYEIPFGIVRREPYGVRDTCRGEWPAHRFVALENRDGGVALVNTGAIGVETTGGIFRTTLLRAPEKNVSKMAPDETSSQHGRHEFRFALVPYRDHAAGDAAADAQAVNNPLLARAGERNLPAQVEMWSENAVLSTVKFAEDGSDELIVRVYRPADVDEDRRVALHLRGATEAWASDLLEARGEALHCRNGRIVFDVGSFEIKSIRVKR